MTAAVAAAEARWQHAHHARKRSWTLAAVIFGAALIAAATIGEADLGRLLHGLPMAAEYVWRTIPVLRPAHLVADLDDWMWGLPGWIVLMGDTLLVAYAGSVLGAAAGLLLSFSAATTLSPPWAVAASRRVLELARTVPVLVYALVFVYAFGLGPFAGMLAIALHTAGALGKLYAEVHENADLGPLDAIRASGGSWVQGMRYGILPQSLPGVLSFGLLRFEINVREASVLGIVGAGGIGEELYLAVRQFVYPDISAILVLILLTVSCIDIGCGFLRRRVIGAPA